MTLVKYTDHFLELKQGCFSEIFRTLLAVHESHRKDREQRLMEQRLNKLQKISDIITEIRCL